MKILIVGPAWVGDMVMAQSLFICLQRLNPETIIDVLAPSWTKPLLQCMPQVNEAIAMPLEHGELKLGFRRRLGKTLAKANYDQAIVLPNSFKSALVPWFAGIPLRTGWRGEARSWLLNDYRLLDKSHYPLMVQRFNALAWPAGHPVEDIPMPAPALTVAADDVQTARQQFALDNDRPVVVCCPGAEYGPSKQWPARHFASLAAQLIADGKQVWLLGSAKDRSDCGAITEQLDDVCRTHCHNLAGETSLRQAIDLMAAADQVVSNDSGLMHVAAALDKPMVVVYGSTSPAFTPPLSKSAKKISLSLDCSPCFERKCPLGHHRCMADLEPVRVLSELPDKVNNQVK